MAVRKMNKLTIKTAKIEIFILILLAVAKCTFEYETKYQIDDFSKGSGETLSFSSLPSFQCFNKYGYANPICEQDYVNINEQQLSNVPGGVRTTEYAYHGEAAHYAQNNLDATATGSILFNNAFSTTLNVTNTGDDDIFVFITTTLSYIQYPSCLFDNTTGKYSPSGCEKYIGHEVNLIQYGGDALAFKYKSQTLNVARLSVGAKSATTPSPNEKEFAAYHAVTVSDYDETTDEYLVPLAFIADDDFDLDFTRTTHLEFKFSSDIYCCVEEYQMLSSGEFATFDFEINDIRIVSTTDTNSLSSLSLSDNSSNNSSLSSPLFNFNSVLLVLFICFIFCLF